MTTTFDLESVEGVATCIAHGPLTLDEIKEIAATMWVVNGLQIRFLWDLRDARFDLGPAEVRGLAEFVKRLALPTAFRSAFVASRDLEFGLLGMFAEFRKTEGALISVFRDKHQAVEWLTSDTA